VVPRRLRWLAVAIVLCSGCAAEPRAITAQRVGLTSLIETAAMVGAAWLSGGVSSTYAETAFAASEQLLAKQQSALSADLGLLATAEGAALSQSEERLSRTLASLSDAVTKGDASAMRRHLGELRSSSSPP
jgi:hypothetical protein